MNDSPHAKIEWAEWRRMKEYVDHPFITWFPDVLVHRIAKFGYFHRMLTERAIGVQSMGACLSDTVTANVPYYGGLIEVDREYAVEAGCLPLWASPTPMPTTIRDYIREKHPDRMYPEIHYDGQHPNDEHEWFHPGSLFLPTEAVKGIWVLAPLLSYRKINYHMRRQGKPLMTDDEFWKLVYKIANRAVRSIKKLAVANGYDCPVYKYGTARYKRHFKADIDAHRREKYAKGASYDQIRPDEAKWARGVSRYVHLGVFTWDQYFEALTRWEPSTT